LHSETAGAFAKRYEADADYEQLHLSGVSPGDIPALVIRPATVDVAWFTNKMQHWVGAHACEVYTAPDRLSQAESLIEKVCNAIYRAEVPGEAGVLVVERRTNGYLPQRIGPVEISMIALGQGEAKAMFVLARCIFAVIS